MGIGVGIFLVALGAILTFAVDVSLSGLDIAVVGIVLMLAGIGGIILDVAVFAPRRRRVVYDERPDAEVYDEPVVTGRSRYRRRRVTVGDEYPPMR